MSRIPYEKWPPLRGLLEKITYFLHFSAMVPQHLEPTAEWGHVIQGQHGRGFSGPGWRASPKLVRYHLHRGEEDQALPGQARRKIVLHRDGSLWIPSGSDSFLRKTSPVQKGKFEIGIIWLPNFKTFQFLLAFDFPSSDFEPRLY